VTLEVDHIHPRSKGGTDHPDNLVTACWDCNAGKRANLLTDKMPPMFTEAKELKSRNAELTAQLERATAQLERATAELEWAKAAAVRSRIPFIQREAIRLRDSGCDEAGVCFGLKTFISAHFKDGETYPVQKIREWACWAIRYEQTERRAI
jgi:hypothetical protein